jgi:hypothetical protein
MIESRTTTHIYRDLPDLVEFETQHEEDLKHADPTAELIRLLMIAPFVQNEYT